MQVLTASVLEAAVNNRLEIYMGTKKYLSIMLLVLLTGCSFPYLASREHRVFESIRDAVVQVGQYTGGYDAKVGQLLGSGFFIDEKCTVVTARHILNNAKTDKLYIKYIPPGERNKFQTYPAEVIHRHQSKDLAFLRARACTPVTTRPLSLVRKLDDLSVLGGEAVFIGGFPRVGFESLDYPVIRRSSIASTEYTDAKEHTPLLLLDLAGAPGFSGSPVVVERSGKVVGVVRGSVKRSGIGSDYTLEGATPITQVDYDEAIKHHQAEQTGGRS